MKKKAIKQTLGPGCKQVPRKITRLGLYFDVINGLLKNDDIYWFRGNSDLSYCLIPSALRYSTPSDRNNALNLLDDFKRYGELKLKKAPGPNEDFKWIQLAQHYGLPTRLLDWTRNAAIALYFACDKQPDKDGAVFILNPIDLNRAASTKDARIFDPNRDTDLIGRYLNLDGETNSRGLKTIAVNPPWNSERIMLQQGVFTLHGSRDFSLNDKQVPSLVYLKIEEDYKATLRQELERIGVNEMSIFPEAEHMCRYLKWRDKLDN